MDIVTMLQEYFIIPAIVVCLVVGYCVKNTPILAKISNGYIPIITVICGVLVACALNWGNITTITVIGGMVSGVVSNRFYDAFRLFIENKGDNKNGL